MDLQDMHIFARVAAVQNLSSVGTELGLTPGTISKRIQALEEELCVRLFDRTTRSIKITEEGATLLEYVDRILSDVEHARAAVTAHVLRPKGRLRVSAPASLGREVIAPAICRFMAEYEEIDVHIDLTDRIVSLQEEGYDVVIRTGSLDSCALKAKRLAIDPQVLVASPSYLQQRGIPSLPEELQSHSCLVLGDSATWGFRRHGEESSVRVSGRLRSDNGELLRQAAIEGYGILRVSRRRVCDDIEKGLLRQVLDGFEPASATAVWALYPSSRHMLPKLRVFLDFLARWFRDEQAAGHREAKPARPAAKTTRRRARAADRSG